MMADAIYHPVHVIDAVANVIDSDATLAVSAGGEGIFDHLDSVDLDSSTAIFYCTDGHPYEVRVRRVTAADRAANPDGIVPSLPLTPRP